MNDSIWWGRFSHAGMAGYDEFEYTTADRRPSCVRENSGRSKNLFSRPQREPAGRFLKITEDVSGRRDTIMLPASALQEFVEALTRILDIEQRL